MSLITLSEWPVYIDAIIICRKKGETLIKNMLSYNMQHFCVTSILFNICVYVYNYFCNSNSVVNIISNIAICNPMSTAGKNYRSVLDVNGQYNNNQLIHDWNLTSNRLKNLTSTLSKLIDSRDGYKECDGLTCDDINAFILDLCTN